MQTIPAAVETLLKTRKMVGADRPAHEVAFFGMPSSDPEVDFSTITWTRPQTDSGGNFSFAKCANGKIVVVYGGGAALTQAYADNVNDLLSGSNVLSDHSSIFTGSSLLRGTVFNVGDDLFLTIARARSAASDDKQQVQIYKSPSGNGGDWELRGTIREIQEVEAYSMHKYVPVGSVLVLPSGRWVVSYPYFRGGSALNFVCFPAVAVSDDGGLTWTHKSTLSTSNYVGWVSRVLGYYDDKIWVQYTTETSSGTTFLCYGYDNGNSWLSPYNLQAELSLYRPGNGVFFTRGGYLHWLSVQYGVTDRYIYRTKTPLQPNTWERVYLDTTESLIIDAYVATIDNHLIISLSHFVNGISLPDIKVAVKSITIDRSRGAAAAQATITLDNTGGAYSPDGTGDWAGVIMPNALVTIKQGYGADLVQTFIGYIDSVEMSNFPAELRISCRDKGKLALDRIVTNSVDGGHYVKFTSTTVEDAVTALAGLCGLTTGTVEATGMTLTSKLFSWESYADAIDWLADISNSCWRVDELGVLHFTRDVMPASPATAYSFAEGEDIISLGYLISDEQLYYTATVYGVDANDAVIKASANFGAPLTYGLFSQKVLKIDAPDADTVAKCQEIADRTVALMLCRCRVVDFAAIAVPWLQVGDFIQVTETTSTISELYRITNISLNQDPGGFVMAITCYWYGEVPS